MSFDAGKKFCLIEIVGEMFGDDAAAQVVDRLGGLKFYVAKVPSPACPLVDILGRKRADQLGDAAGGVWFNVPRALQRRTRNAMIDKLSRQKVRVVEIARRVGLSERQVYHLRRLRRLGREPRS